MKDKIRSMSKRSLAFFAAALLLFGAGGISASTAALNAISETYDAELNMAPEMKVTIVEGSGDSAVDAGASSAVLTALKDDKGEDIQITPGKIYDETLSLRNVTGHPMYVRAVVRKYWLDKEGNKGTNLEDALDPSLIRLTYDGSDFNSADWILNDNESTQETSVYYYRQVLTGDTAPLFDGVSIDPEVAKAVTIDNSTKKGDKTIIKYSYKYDGCTVCLEVEAQAVQTHNAEDAIKSIWGVNASVSGSSITSVN